jgi:hypothetical protein
MESDRKKNVRNPSETESRNQFLDPKDDDYKVREEDREMDKIRKKTPATTGGNLAENEFITDRDMKKNR